MALGAEDAHADDDVAGAVGRLEVPLALIDLGDLTVIALSEAALQRLGERAGAVVGQSALDALPASGRGHASIALEAMRAGAIDFYRAHRILRASAQAEPIGSEWVRAVQFGDRRVALVEMAVGEDVWTSPLVEYFGRDLLPMAIGIVDEGWVITAISSDIVRVLDSGPDEFVGRLLLGAVQQEDVARLLTAAAQAGQTSSVALTVRFRDGHGRWTPLCCVLTSLAASGDRCFIVVAVPTTVADQSSARRVEDLEGYLRVIAAEVVASGVLAGVGPLPDARQFPQIGSLNRGEWEVLSRLYAGERVPGMAAALTLSQSTIRNRLSSIFRRFGVHSQSELLALLRTADGSSS